MADENVVVGIETKFDDDGTNQAIRSFGRLNLAVKALGKSQDDYVTSGTRMSRHMSDMDKKHNRMISLLEKQNRILKMGLKPMLSTITMGFRAMTAALMPLALGLAGFVATLASAKAALWLVENATKAWNFALKGLAAGAAVALGAVSSLAAAMSELKAAAAAPFTGVGSKQMQGVFGALMGDPKIAALGVDNIQNASTALLKMKVPVGDLNKYLKELGDYAFYAGGGDAGAGITGIIGAMKELGTGTMSSEALETFAASFGEMGPAITEAGKAFVGKDVQDFLNFLTSNPVELAAFNDGLKEFNNTMIGTMKSFRPMIQAALEPFGQTLNDTAKGPLKQFRNFLVDLVKNIMPSVVLFLGGRLPGVLQRLQGLLTNLANKFKEVLATVDPEKDGFGSGMSDFFTRMQEGWSNFKPILEDLAAGFDALWGFMKPILAALGGMLGRILMGGSKGLSDNADAWASAGESIALIFRPGGPVEVTLTKLFEFGKMLVTTLGPGIIALLEGFKSPMYAIEEITSHPETMEEIGDNLERIGRSAGPIFDLLADVIGVIIEALPEITDLIADIAEFASRVATGLQPVVSIFGKMAESALLIKTVFMFLISKAVLGKVAALFGTTMMGGKTGGLLGMAARNPMTTTALIGAGLLLNGMGTRQESTPGGYDNNSVGPGFLSSALGGALLGAKFGPIGAGIGLFIGGTIGGARGAGEDAEDASQAGINRVNAIVSGNLNQQTNFGFYSTAEQTRDKLATELRTKGLTMAADDAALYIQKINQINDQIGTGIEGNFTANLFALEKAFGSYEDVAKAADDAGVNLMDGAVSLDEAIEMLNGQVEKMKSAGTLFSEALDRNIYDPRKAKEYTDFVASLPETVNSMIANMGEVTISAAQGLGDSIISNWEAKVPTIGVGKATEGMVDDLTTLKEALFFSGQLEAAGEVQLLIDGALLSAKEAKAEAKQQRKEIRQMVKGIAEEFGKSVPEVLSRMSSAASSVYSSISAISRIRFTVSADGRISVTTGGSGPGRTVNGLYDSGIRFIDENGNGIDDRLPGGDTKSPRSALLNTSRMHALIDGSLPGKRSVTSMWRNTNLGSSNSDHVTGRALDIVGDNLGSYAQMMRASGGFAEFHGTGKGRHLHVVPPQLPVGDRPTPRVPMNMASQPQTQNINTTVYAPPGINEEMVARRTARHIADAQRNAAERR